MFDSIDDWLIIAVVAGVLLYGSSQVPKLAHNLGRSMGEFKRGRLEVEKEIRAQQTADTTATSAGAPATGGTPGVPGSSH
ncbi:MAG: twin-arginine translocase TatA/TatE family subunit [Candidatus Thermoplasmatota archaeon]|jgi:sec-independent protein translocase protein TatA|nr:twin-arginine translocase TatA/TatE family subunit [Candidatus Thermoplasmatota archaeon]MCL5983694.1 twin-arginine translocase TatA/TatE family subunit [Candidatus Thermoplasmatota archaeon]